MKIFFFLLASIQLVSGSSILVDWSPFVIPDAQSYVLDYSPPVGTPPAGTSLPGNTRRSLLNGTIPAAEYTIYISAITGQGSRRNVTEITYYSSPDAPILDSIETTEHEATISYFPPQGNDISYYIEYYPEGHQEYSNAVETKASLVRLRGLESGTGFRLKIKSIYKGVRSQTGIEASFKTQGDPVYDYSSSSSAEASFSVRTLPPDFDLATTQEPLYEEFSKETDAYETTTEAFYTYEVSAETTEGRREHETTRGLSLSTTFGSTATQTSVTTPTTTTSSSSSAVPTTTTTDPQTTTSTAEVTTTASTTSATTTARVPMAAFPVPTEEEQEEESRNVVEQVDMGEYDGGEHSVLIPLEQMKKEYGEPARIDMGEEDGMIRLDWSTPEGTLCDAFFLNYTILSLSRPKSFSIATSDDFTMLKMFPEHTLDLRVFCMLAGALSKTWWAQRIAYLSKPKKVEGVKVVSLETNEFYVSSMSIDWDWPSRHDFNLYKIVISYGTEKATPTEIEVFEKGPILIDKLDPAVLYKIEVRNASTELDLRSKPVEITQITPPLISSTLYPGQISSTAININFGESDPEQGRFDHYVLTFSGNNKNYTKRIEMHEERSLTFTKLIPGKTYEFNLYTVYKGVRSRPVTEAVTTYPLKVNELFPVVGRDYVTLYWDIENFADSDCRFRVSYNADKISPVSVELKGASRHRFTGLQMDTYYTFTITVIMGIGKAAAESESEMITVHVPKGRLSPTVQRQGTRELSVSFDNDHNVFSSLNGQIQNYAVIVTDDVDENDDIYELKSWFEVKDEETWGSYRASPSDWNPFSQHSSRTAVFVVGTEDCVRRNLDEPYCNGILRANVDYMVKVRAYADSKVAMETEWAAIDGVVAEEDEEQTSERRLPCHMYLNGCPRKSSPFTNNILLALATIPLILLIRLL